MKAGSRYLKKPYRNIDDLVADVAALRRLFSKEMRRKTGQKVTVLGSLKNTTSPTSLEYLANHARFVARNPSVKVPNGTLPNEAYHMELKQLFRNIRRCRQTYARTHAKVATAVKLIGGHLSEAPFTKSDRQTTLLHLFCAKLEKNPLKFDPLLTVQEGAGTAQKRKRIVKAMKK